MGFPIGKRREATVTFHYDDEFNRVGGEDQAAGTIRWSVHELTAGDRRALAADMMRYRTKANGDFDDVSAIALVDAFMVIRATTEIEGLDRPVTPDEPLTLEEYDSLPVWMTDRVQARVDAWSKGLGERRLLPEGESARQSGIS